VNPQQLSAWPSPCVPSSFVYLPVEIFSFIGFVIMFLISLGIVIVGTKIRRRLQEVDVTELATQRPKDEEQPLLPGGRDKGNTQS
jgi:hypothetical protein